MPTRINPEDRRLDWRKSTDPRNALHPFTAAEPIPRRKREWTPGPVLDQGPDGACVGFGWTAELLASPVRVHLRDGYAFAMDIYHEAQREDEWQGEDYEGTSVNAGAIAVRAAGYIAGWRWANNISTVIDALITQGPVVIGIPWLTGMFHPHPTSGLLNVTGNVAGGHCLLAYRYHPTMRLPGYPANSRHEVIGLRNSWGETWGQHGSARILADDLANLLAQGEAAVPMGRLPGLPT